MAQYVINLREGGAIHRINAEALKMSHRKRKTCCGWSFGLGVSSVKICAHVATNKRCRKCFSADDRPSGGREARSASLGVIIAEEMTSDEIEDL